MILDYIRHPTCIVLAVSPANADIVNSDALELARSVDPDGHRTIGELQLALPCIQMRAERVAAQKEGGLVQGLRQTADS